MDHHARYKNENHLRINGKNKQGDDCVQNVADIMTQLFYDKWGYCGTKGTVKERGKQFKKKLEMK